MMELDDAEAIPLRNHELHGNRRSATSDAADPTSNASFLSPVTTNLLGIVQQGPGSLESRYRSSPLGKGKDWPWLGSNINGSGPGTDQRMGALQDVLGNGQPRAAKRKKSRATSYRALPPSEEPTASPLALEKSTSISMAAVEASLTDVHSLTGLESGQIRAFAKLEFDDGPFYMNTYSVELGRDVRAAKAAGQDGSKTQERSKRKDNKRSSSLAPPVTPQAKRDRGEMVSRSVVSESGGIMAVDLPGQKEEGHGSRKSKNRRQGKTSQSTSSSRAVSRKNSSSRSTFHSGSQSFPATMVSHRASYSHPVNPFSLLPSPNECPLIPIHPPAVSAETGGHRGISRKHVKIKFNFERNLFELHIKGINGAFVDDRWHASGETLPLRSGTHIQIGGVSLRFVLPDIVADEAVADEEKPNEEEVEEGASVAGDDSSDDDESDDSQDEVVVLSEEDEQEEEKSSDGDEVEGVDVREEIELTEAEVKDMTAEVSPSPPPIPKKRGPGRPPKNGKMSIQKQKEAQRLVQKEKEVKKKDTPPPVVPKRKVGRPRKHPLPENGPSTEEKKKNPKNNDVETTAQPLEGNKKPSGDATEGKAVTKEKKEKKPPKPPRSPSPVFNEAELTPEQLQKPQSSYVVLIHEALSNSVSGPLTLPQIYRAIERRYPYFKLRVTTTGWQSSVRHNLSQSNAFQKVQRDGKGWMWGLVEGVSIQKERKRKVSTGENEKQSAQMNGDQLGLPVDTQQGNSLPNGHAHPPPPPPPALPPSSGAGGIKQLSGYPPHHGHYAQQITPFSHPPSSRAPFLSYLPQQFSNPPHPQLPSATQSARVYQTPYAPLPSSTNGHILNVSRPTQPNPSIQQVQPRLAPQVPPFPSNPPQPTMPQPNAKETKPQNPTTLLAAISNFKSALINSLDKKIINASYREQIVQSAINRALGITEESSVIATSSSTTNGSATGNADAEAMVQIEAHERMIMKAVKTLIRSFTGPAANSNHGPSGVRNPTVRSGPVNNSSRVSGTVAVAVAVAGSSDSREAATRKRTFEDADAAEEGIGVEGGETAMGPSQMNKRVKLTSE
ncbi:MAG: hypothetical protein M1816_007731 [Peltula sp. TS41687]|nr:MAG: hypothetical protein M1816_007731 [Peltula sp. TS41687]